MAHRSPRVTGNGRSDHPTDNRTSDDHDGAHHPGEPPTCPAPASAAISTSGDECRSMRSPGPGSVGTVRLLDSCRVGGSPSTARRERRRHRHRHRHRHRRDNPAPRRPSPCASPHSSSVCSRLAGRGTAAASTNATGLTTMRHAASSVQVFGLPLDMHAKCA
jgi:hypothetical protein